MINNTMNYKKHYDKLMERSKTRILGGYVEKHHIVPRCLGGTDDAGNIALLTPEEHFVAHQLLVKIYPKSSPLTKAVVIMTAHQTQQRANNKLFGWLRKRASVQQKQWIAENGHPRGMLGKTHTAESNEQRSKTCKRSMIESVGVRVYAYNLDGSFYKEFRTISDCAEHLNTSPSNVKYTAEGKFQHCANKQIRYDYVESLAPYKNPNLGKVYNSVICPNCKKEGAGPSMKRFHFEKCKERI
jgi:hypothetical protein